jgi:iron complex outermembrane receptor protein
MRAFMRAAFAASVVLWVGSSSAAAYEALLVAPADPHQATGILTGRVLDEGGQPVTDAVVRITDIRRQTKVDASGQYRFENVPAGEHIVEVQSPREGSTVARITVASEGETALELSVAEHEYQETVVVSASANARTSSDLAQAVTVLGGSDLVEAREATLGETLARTPGVNSTYFGPGASRPVIRGLGGDRVRMLESGVGTADASNTSPDHAVSLEPASAELIEVIRGPATLLYGSAAIGGIVNVFDGRIPDELPAEQITGVLDGSLGSVSDEKLGSASFDVKAGRLVFHADGQYRDAGDISIPGLAESEAFRAAEEAEHAGEEEGHAEVEGTVPNSAIENKSLGFGVSFVGDHGFLGASVSGLDSTYGLPGHSHEGEAPAEEPGAGPHTELQQRRFDLMGERREPFAGFHNVKVRFGLADYEHAEIEPTGEVGTQFLNDEWEGRLELVHEPIGALNGSFGVQFGNRDFEASGEEAFIAPTKTKRFAAFIVEEVGKGTVRGQFGARVDHNNLEVAGDAPDERSLTGFSGSAGLVWRGASGWSTGLTGSSSAKLPNVEELYSNGPHAATSTFEVGNPDLDVERSLGIDLTIRKRGERLSGEVGLFASWFQDYIHEDFTGEEEDGLPVIRYTQADAQFVGAEAAFTLDVLHKEPHHLDLEVSGDYVRAELTDSNEPLPRIPPFRYGVGLHYRGDRPWARVELRGVAEQDRISEFETSTDGYTFLNASLGYRVFAGRSVVDFILRGTNLTDEEGRVHTSYLKELVPLPGRDVRLSVRMTF